jgi:hypothetical protein
MHSSFRAALFGAAVVLAFVAPGFAQTGAKDFAGRTLTASPRTSWPTNGGNLYNPP